MFPKRSSKNYDSPADGELQGNYTLVDESDSVNDDAERVDSQGDLQQMNISSVSCPESTVPEARLKGKPGRHSLPADARAAKEKRTSLKKRLSFRLFESKGRKKQCDPKDGADGEHNELLERKESSDSPGQLDGTGNGDASDVLDTNGKTSDSVKLLEDNQNTAVKCEHSRNIERIVDTVVCHRHSSLLEEILAETGHLDFTTGERKSAEI